jgi:chromosome segregation ATPase
MNDVTLIDSPTDFAERAVILLKEYLNKFRSLKKQLRSLRAEYDEAVEKSSQREIIKAEIQALEQYFSRLNPAVVQFRQQVSGMIDQGKVTPLARVELQLRLAELESVLTQMPFLFNAYRPR